MFNRRFRKALLAASVLVSILFTVAGCGKSGEDDPGKNAPPAEKAARQDKKGD